MKTFEKIDLFKERPEATAFYYTDKGYLKFDLVTDSFYDNGNNRIKVNFFFKDTEKNKLNFDSVVMPVIKYLCENHHPHVTVIITPTNAELLEGLKTTRQIMDFVKD